MRDLIDVFSRHPIIKAVNGDAISLTFEVEVEGKPLYIIVEDIPSNYPPSVCWVFDDKDKLEEILEILETNGWDIITNEVQ